MNTLCEYVHLPFGKTLWMFANKVKILKFEEILEVYIRVICVYTEGVQLPGGKVQGFTK